MKQKRLIKNLKNLFILSSAPLTALVATSAGCAAAPSYTKNPLAKTNVTYNVVNSYVKPSVINTENLSQYVTINPSTDELVIYKTISVSQTDDDKGTLKITVLLESKEDSKLTYSKEILIKGFLKNIKAQPLNPRYQQFFNEIIDSAENSVPTVFMSRNAAQYFNSAFMLMLGELNYKNRNQDSLNDVLFLIDNSVYDKANTGTQRFNFDYLLQKYGDVLQTPGQYNIGNGKLMVASQLKDMNPSLNDDANEKYNVFPRTLKELLTYLKPYKDAGVNKFDFYIPDISFPSLPAEVRNYVLEHANKIVLLSDGNAQPYKFVETSYQSWANRTSSNLSKDEIAASFEEMQRTQKQTIDYRYYFQLTDKVKLYNFDGSYIEYFNKELRTLDKANLSLSIKDYPTDYSQVFKNDKLEMEKAITEYEKLNRLEVRNALDFVIHGKEHYDSSKKNLVFMGSSLFRKYETKVETDPLYGKWRIKELTENREEIISFINAIKIKYPESEYNYMYKMHPVYSKDESIEYIRTLFGDNNKAIILDSSVSWENIIAVDHSKADYGKSVFFNQTFNNDSKTHIFGIQASSTVLLSTLAFVRSAYNLSLEQAKAFVDPEDFAIPTTFHIIKRDQVKPKNGFYDTNIKELDQVYKYFIPSKTFFELSEFKSIPDFVAKWTKIKEAK
ncbi:lipoprotein 17-related variable surface protein [Mycoplasma sp. 4463]|uniref:lipoprotein 17-related variable surface protein n=1 Tax=Mycoplasma sp. 4463 TaxID=3400998 RepID=UPI003AAF41A7